MNFFEMAAARIRRILWQMMFALCLYSFVDSALAALVRVSSEVDCREQLTKNVVENNFPTNRGIEDYLEFLGESFLDDVLSLTDQSHWIDMGAGQLHGFYDFTHLVQMRRRDDEWLAKYSGQPSRYLHLSAVVVTLPPEGRENAKLLAREQGEKFKLYEGRFVEQIPVTEFNAADLITDVYGPLHYSQHPGLVLEQYLHILKVGGKLYFFVDQISDVEVKIHGNYSNFNMRSNKSRVLTVQDWLSKISGIEFIVSKSGLVKITKTSERVNLPAVSTNLKDVAVGLGSLPARELVIED